MRKVILHLCADIGSDSKPYSDSREYDVIKIGEKIGVENFEPPENVHGIIANPPCTDLSTAKGFHKENNTEKGMELVRHCLRVIEKASPKWWVLENPAKGVLRKMIGEPVFKYQPWKYGSPWTKETALWGKFTPPPFLFEKWEDIEKIGELYVRPGRSKPSLAFLHKSAIKYIDEFAFAKDFVKSDADFRSLCSQKFATEFLKHNP